MHGSNTRRENISSKKTKKKKTKKKTTTKNKTKKQNKKNVKTLNRYCSHAIYVQVKGRTIWTKTPISFRMLSNNYQQMTFGFFFVFSRN